MTEPTSSVLKDGISAIYPVDSRDETVIESTPVIDMINADENMLVMLDVEAGTGTNPTLDMTIEHSEDDSTWATIPADALYDLDTGDAATFDQVTDSAADFQILGLRRGRLRRYLRGHLAIAGDANPDFICAAYLISRTKYTDWLMQ